MNPYAPIWLASSGKFEIAACLRCGPEKFSWNLDVGPVTSRDATLTWKRRDAGLELFATGRQDWARKKYSGNGVLEQGGV